MGVEGCWTTKLRPRDRIVVSARDLFHRHGIRGIGVDAIAEAAGTNKMTLYRHFGSKDDLVIACLRAKAAETEQAFLDMETMFPGDSLAQLHEWIRRAARHILAEDRGCDIANAAVELADADHPARRVVEEMKTRFRDLLADLCHRAGIEKAELLADSLYLLLEGARVSRQSIGATGPSAQFVAMAEAVIAAFGGVGKTQAAADRGRQEICSRN